METFVLPDFITFKSETRAKSILFANPKLESLLLRVDNEAGTYPVAIFQA